MSSSDVEIRLLREYRDIAYEKAEGMTWKEITEGESEALAKRVSMYKRQLANCDTLRLEFDQRFHTAECYYLEAMLELRTKRFSDGLLGSSPELIMSRRAGRAIDLIGQAIGVRNSPTYRLYRARLNYYIRHRPNEAMKDIEYVIATHADDEEAYMEARRMKDEIEA